MQLFVFMKMICKSNDAEELWVRNSTATEPDS